ncbi:uncharacterized protein LOC120704476 isoform X1 [Panicum virgatum]|uniref:DUF8204 domain-containing protein n=1 Tax=Panicum virgatum TaxID=38727 RepID=A0A8T0U005_PANVG|nr:uncharacterized protein LOC120704476 isoform X1 [Panicum virgatum]KAG2614204.1 hypothetical protein PVAP13_4KG375203 [Panicum virgatum]
MERSRGEAGAPTPPTPAAAAAAGAGGGAAKGMSCKGCLFYSSVLRSRERGPVCVGITRALPQVSGRMIGEIKPEHSKGDCQFRDLSYFKYACVGYSIYLDDKETSVGVHEKAHEQLPVCFGAEILVGRRDPVNKAPSYNKKEAPQPHRYKPGHAGDDLFTKFQRNAGLVANGVAKNLKKVGTYIKDTMGDMMYPDRKRPK